MPEGDTLRRTADGLRPHLVGRVVTAARSGGPGARPQADRLVGATVTEVEAVGKNLLIRFDSGLEIRTHLRMNGSWHRYRPGEPWRRPVARARLVIECPGTVAVCFDAPVVELLETRAERLHPAIASLGPDLLAPDFDPAGRTEALHRLREPSRAGRPIAEILLDQRALAGIGNVYKSEVLFRRSIDPFVEVRDLADDDLRGLIDDARSLMLENVDRTRTERVTTGADRRAVGPLWVYGRAGRPCRRCRRLIVSARQGDPPRVTYWCPGCQSRPVSAGS
jgi:endonuclease VIII